MKVLGWAQRFGLHHFKASGAMLLAGLFFAGPVFGAEAAHSQPPEALVRVVVVGDIMLGGPPERMMPFDLSGWVD